MCKKNPAFKDKLKFTATHHRPEKITNGGSHHTGSLPPETEKTTLTTSSEKNVKHRWRKEINENVKRWFKIITNGASPHVRELPSETKPPTPTTKR